jgi:protein phosphatase
MGTSSPIIHVAAASDIGMVRSVNQDSYLSAPEKGLFIVADGMGGHQGGEVASAIVVRRLPGLLEEALLRAGVAPADLTDEQIRIAMYEALALASAEVHAAAQDDPALHGMGATVVMLVLRGRLAYIAHLGDSRIYLCRNGELRRLTQDHTLGMALLKLGQVKPEEVESHPGLRRLTKVAGMEGTAEPEVDTLAIMPGDRVLLCSDGLTTMLSDADIGRVLVAAPNSERACQQLIIAANEGGGRDNITAIVLTVE